jgi:hypothetical protein
MKMSKRTLLTIIAIILLALALLALRPLPEATADNCTSTYGTVISVVNGGGLKDDNKYYYINRGEERGLSVSHLQSTLPGKHVILQTIDHWTPFDPSQRSLHVARIIEGKNEIYSEY